MDEDVNDFGDEYSQRRSWQQAITWNRETELSSANESTSAPQQPQQTNDIFENFWCKLAIKIIGAIFSSFLFFPIYYMINGWSFKGLFY